MVARILAVRMGFLEGTIMTLVTNRIRWVMPARKARVVSCSGHSPSLRVPPPKIPGYGVRVRGANLRRLNDMVRRHHAVEAQLIAAAGDFRQGIRLGSGSGVRQIKAETHV